MNTRTKVLAVIVLAVFVLFFAAAGTQSQSPDDITSLVVAIVVIAGFFGLLFLLERNQRRAGGLFTGPMTPLKRILALVLALFFGGFALLEIVFAHSIHFLYPIVAIACLIFALRPSPAAHAKTESVSQSEEIPRLDQAAWVDPQNDFAPKRRWLPIALIAVGMAGVLVIVIGLVVVTNQRQSAAEVAPPATAPWLGTATPPPAGPSKSAHSEAESHYQLGDAYTTRHDYERAIDEYSQAIAIDSAYFDAYIYRGSAYENQGQFDLARKDYDAALKLDPASATAYFKRAILFYDTGDQARALEDLGKVIEIEPQFTQAYVNRGLIYDERKEYDQALADFDRALQLTSSDPELAGYYFNRAVTHFHQKNYERSVSDLTQAIKLKPDYAKAFFLRGAILANGVPQDARSDLETALKLGLEPQLESQAKQMLEQLSTP